MAESVCPRCKAVLQGERVRFCAQCGCNLSETQDVVSPEGTEGQRDRGIVETQDFASPHVASVPGAAGREKEATYLAALRGHLAGGEDLSPEAVQELNKLAATLGISETQSSRLMGTAIDSLRPSKTDDLDEPVEPHTAKGLMLSVNVNRFYMAGIDGILDVQLENLSDEVYDNVDVIASGNLLGRTEKWNCRFDKCGSRSELFEVRPERPGPKIIRFFVDARQGHTINSYDAKCDLPVFANNQDLRDVLQQASNMGNVSAGTGKFMGNSISSNIQIMVDQGKIRDANDLMLEYGRLSPRFVQIELRHDPKRSDDLTAAWRQKSGVRRIVEPLRGSLTDCGSLLIQAKNRPANILLLAKPRVTLGKGRSSDIVTRICPRSPGNDYQSNQMSREHCAIELTKGGVHVKDSGSVNGTFVDGQRLDADGVRIDTGSHELDLAGVLKLTVRIIEAREHAGHEMPNWDQTQNPACLQSLADKAKVDSLVLERAGNLGPDDDKGSEGYCLVYHLATIGSDAACALCVADKGLEPVHAAVVYLRDRFYLENLSEVANVVVNDRTLSRSELMPLSFGDRIHVGRLEMEFTQRRQLFIDL